MQVKKIKNKIKTNNSVGVERQAEMVFIKKKKKENIKTNPKLKTEFLPSE